MLLQGHDPFGMSLRSFQLQLGNAVTEQIRMEKMMLKSYEDTDKYLDVVR